MFVQEHVALFLCLCNFASNNRHKAATLNCVPQGVVCGVCSEHTVLFLFFLIQSVNLAARLLRLTAFLRNGGKHVALFLCLYNFASDNCHKAATLNCVPQGVVCGVCSEHTVLFLFFLIQSVNLAARLLRLTAFLRNGGKHVALFLCLYNFASDNCHKAATLNCVPRKCVFY